MMTSLLFEKIAWVKGALVTTQTLPQNKVCDSTGNPELDNIPHAIKTHNNFHDESVVGCCTLGVIAMSLGAYTTNFQGAEVLLKYDGTLEIPLHLRFYKLLREYGIRRAQKVFLEWVGLLTNENPNDARIHSWTGEHNIEHWNDRNDTQFSDVQDFLDYLDSDVEFTTIKECLTNPRGQMGANLWDSYQSYFPHKSTFKTYASASQFHNFDTAENEEIPRITNISESFDNRRSVGVAVLSRLLGGAVED